MKIYFNGKGDESVGIAPIEATLDINLHTSLYSVDEPQEKKDREQMRTQFRKMIEELSDDRAQSVWFEDECPDCIQRLNNKGRCETKGCPSNHEDHSPNCPWCKTPLEQKQRKFSKNIYYQCKRCKTTIEMTDALIELD